MSCVESLVSVSFPLVICAFLFVRLIDWFMLSLVGREGKGRGVPRSLGDVLDDKRGMREDNSGRRRRDVQNMWNGIVFYVGVWVCTWSSLV